MSVAQWKRPENASAHNSAAAPVAASAAHGATRALAPPAAARAAASTRARRCARARAAAERGRADDPNVLRAQLERVAREHERRHLALRELRARVGHAVAQRDAQVARAAFDDRAVDLVQRSRRNFALDARLGAAKPGDAGAHAR